MDGMLGLRSGSVSVAFVPRVTCRAEHFIAAWILSMRMEVALYRQESSCMYVRSMYLLSGPH